MFSRIQTFSGHLGTAKLCTGRRRFGRQWQRRLLVEQLEDRRLLAFGTAPLAPFEIAGMNDPWFVDPPLDPVAADQGVAAAMTGLSQRFSINEGDAPGLSGTVQSLSSRSGLSDPADDDTAAFRWRVVDDVAGTPLDEPSRIVLQWIGGELHRWHEYQVGDGDQFFIGLVEPELRILTAAEARDLLIASAGWLRPPAELPEGQLRVLEAADILPAETDMPLLQDSGDSFSPQTVLGDDNRVRVSWDDVQQFPWYNVGYQRQVYSNGQAFRCTAFLVTPHVTLTNGHCVFNSERGGYAETVQFAPGQFQGATGGAVVRPFDGLHAATAWETNPTYTTDPSDGFAHDYAAVFYENGFDQLGIDTYVPLVFNVEPASVQITGYPGTVHEESSLSMWTDVGDAVVRSWDHRILHHQADTSGGNSGGPMWEWVDGQARVVGVHAFGSTNYNGGPRLTDHNLALIQQWMAWTPTSHDIGDTLAAAEVTGIGPGSGTYTHSTSIGIGEHGDKDVDIYRFDAAAGSTVLLSTSQPAGGNPMDTILRLFDASGTQLAVNDDFGGSLYSHIEHTFAAAGTYYAGVSGYSNFNYDPNVAGSGVAGSTGDYLLTLELSVPQETLYSTGFEPEEGFQPGFIDGQQGWGIWGASTVQPVIRDANPASGSQHLRLAKDPDLDDGALVGGSSAHFGTQPPGRYVVSVDVNLSATGGAGYSVLAYSHSQAANAALVGFYHGLIYVEDALDGTPQWVNTGKTWNVGTYTNLTIDIQADQDTVDYYYGGELIYSNVARAFQATSVERVYIRSDNRNAGDVGDFDNLSVRTGGELGEIRGFKWHDLDGDGFWDAGEPGLEHWEIYLDLNDNGQWDAGEPKTVTGTDGSYSFTVNPGTYTVAEMMQGGWEQTYPGSAPDGAYPAKSPFPSGGEGAPSPAPDEVGLLPLFLDGDPRDFGYDGNIIYRRAPAWDTPETTPQSGGTDVLHILVDFSDMAGPPITNAQAEDTFYAAGEFMRDASWGEFWFENVVITPTFRMPETASWYAAQGVIDGALVLRQHAVSAAANAGFSIANFWSYSVTFDRIADFGWAGLGYVGAPGIWLNGYGDSAPVAAHEFGHNLGARHSGFWSVSDGNPLSPGGQFLEYGDRFDIMGNAYTLFPDNHFNAYWMSQFDWMSIAGNVIHDPADGVHRVYALDSGVGTYVVDRTYALRVPTAGAPDYWIEYRQAPYDNINQAGVQIRWSPDSPASNVHTALLDMSGGGGASQAPLPIGETFTDAVSGVIVTPVQSEIGSDGNWWVDVRIGELEAPPGTHTVTVASGQIVQDVNFGNRQLSSDTTTVVISSANPAIYGDAVFFTATVSADTGTPTGTVQFLVNGTNLGDPVALSAGTAQSIAVSNLNATTHTVAAQYQPDGGFDPSSGQLDGGQQITQRPITVTAVTDTRVYDGTTDSDKQPVIDPGLVGDDTSGFFQTFDTPDVGTGKTLTPDGAVNDGNDGNNYAVTFVQNHEGVILETVEVILELVDLDGVPGIVVGESFDVLVSFVDIRDPQNLQGVYAGYADILFDPGVLQVQGISYSPIYAHGRSGQIDNNAGIVEGAGAFSESLVPPSNTNVFTLHMQAVATGPSVIASAANLGDGWDILLFDSLIDHRAATQFDTLEIQVDGPEVGVQVVAVATPSTSGSTALPSSLATVPLGSTYYVEVWVQDRAVPGVGISGGKVDVNYTTAVADGIAVNQDFDFQPDGVIDDPNGVVRNLGGGTLTGGLGVAPEWARLAYVEFVAAGLGEATFELSSGGMQFSRFGAGNVPWDLVDLGTPVVVDQIGGTRIDMTVVREPTPADSTTGEVPTLPANEDWVHEWQSFWVEIWASTPGSTTVGVAEAIVDLQYHTDYLTAQEIVYGAAWEHPAILIDDQANFVTLHAWTAQTDVGDDAYVLLARVRFASTGDDDVPVDQAAGNIGPYDMQLTLENGQNRLAGANELAAAELGAAPDTELWAVVYDIDDSHQIDFGDFSFFAATFGQTAGPPSSESPYTWWADFDKTGRVDFGDLAFFAPNFGKTRAAVQAGDQTLVFPRNFPDAWRAEAGGGSGQAGEGEGPWQVLPGEGTLDSGTDGHGHHGAWPTPPVVGLEQRVVQPKRISVGLFEFLPGSGTLGFNRPAALPVAGRVPTATDSAFAQIGAEGTEAWTTVRGRPVDRQSGSIGRHQRQSQLVDRWAALEDTLTLLAETPTGQLPDEGPSPSN